MPVATTVSATTLLEVRSCMFIPSFFCSTWHCVSHPSSSQGAQHPTGFLHGQRRLQAVALVACPYRWPIATQADVLERQRCIKRQLNGVQLCATVSVLLTILGREHQQLGPATKQLAQLAQTCHRLDHSRCGALPVQGLRERSGLGGFDVAEAPSSATQTHVLSSVSRVVGRRRIFAVLPEVAAGSRGILTLGMSKRRHYDKSRENSVLS